MFDNSHQKPTLSASNSFQLEHNLNIFSSGFLSVAQAAKLLDKPVMTVRRWCQSGRLAAFEKKFGSKVTYHISPKAVGLLKTELESIQNAIEYPTLVAARSHSDLIDGWLAAMERGTLTGKRYSPMTVEDYAGLVRVFVGRYETVTAGNLQIALADCGGKYAARFKLYKAVICFAKYLKQESQISEHFFVDAKPFFPKRDKEPNRITVDEDGLVQLLEHCKKPIETALIVMLASTGLRVSELCQLQLSDIHLDKRVLVAKHRKGGKTTQLGISLTTGSAIERYRNSLPAWINSPFVFVDEQGQPFTRMGIYHRLRRLSKRAGVPVHPHALRRAFVTINANKGRPLQMLQIACGHSSIKTTMDYCRTTEQEVIAAMQDW